MLLATFLVAGTARARGDFREVIAAVSEVKGEAWAAFRDRHGDRGEIWPSGGAHAKRLAPARAGHCGGEPVEPRIAANKGLQKLATRALTLLNTKT